jgi:hypothetical protein
MLKAATDASASATRPRWLGRRWTDRLATELAACEPQGLDGGSHEARSGEAVAESERAQGD